MEKERWKNVPILAYLKDKIEKIVAEGRYSSVASFVNMAVREKLDRERHIITIEARQEKEVVEA